MNNLPYTSLYVRKANATDWNVLHLYEHLLIASFETEFELRGFSRIAYGWITGETFDQTLFLEAGFYDRAAQQFFDEFMTKASARLNVSLIDTEIEVVQAEERSLFKGLDKAALIAELTKLDAEPLVNFEETTAIEIAMPEKTPANTILRLKKNARKFTVFKVIISLPDGDKEDSAVFMRLTPIIFRIVTNYINLKGGYMYDYTREPYYNLPRHSIYEAGTFGMRRDVFSQKPLKAELEALVRNYDAVKDEAALLLYATAFEAMPTWNTFPIDYFRNTGLLVSRKKIRELFTAKQITQVLKRVNIDIEG